jgi:squalene-associated FAD-dependent desaturase
VTLVEARPWLGGATFSVERDGLWLDNGQHVFLRCCPAYRGLLARLGVESQAHLQERLDVPVVAPGGPVGRLARSNAPAPLQLAGSLTRYPFLGIGDKLRLGRAVAALGRLDLHDPGLDDQPFGEWLAARGQRPAALADLWDLITLPTVNLPAREASLALAAKVFKTGLLEETDAADIGFATVPLQRLHGDAAARALSAVDAVVHLRASVTAVFAEADSVTVAWKGGSATGDAVIVAVPHDTVADLLPPATLPAGVEPVLLGASPILNLHVAYDRRVSDRPICAALRSPVQWVFDRTESSGLAEGQLLAVSLSAADQHVDRSLAELRRIFLPALAELFPKARTAEVRSFFATREPRATFRGAPGTARHRAGTVTLNPRIFLAGAWTDTGWPATMEGAVRSGLAAAGAALQTSAVGTTRELAA